MKIDRSDVFSSSLGRPAISPSREIFPAIHGLIRDERPSDCRSSGVARSGDLASLRDARAAEPRDQAAPRTRRRRQQALLAQLRYVKGGSDDEPGHLPRTLRRELGGAAHLFHYLAIPPSLFHAGDRVDSSSLAVPTARESSSRNPSGATSPVRGHSTRWSAGPSLKKRLPDRSFPRQGVRPETCSTFGSPTRSSSRFWNRDRIASVRSPWPNLSDVADHGAFYDEVGAIRETSSRTTLLQVVSSSWPWRRRPAKVRPSATSSGTVPRLRSTARRERRGARSVRRLMRRQGGQATRRRDVSAALRLRLDTWRWTDVPFYIRTGKSLPVTATEVLVELRRPPLDVFGGSERPDGDYVRFPACRRTCRSHSVLGRRHRAKTWSGMRSSSRQLIGTSTNARPINA